MSTPVPESLSNDLCNFGYSMEKSININTVEAYFHYYFCSECFHYSFLVRSESWTIKKAEYQRIDAFELPCWRTLLTVP